MSEKKLMTVADLAAYLRTIPNQNMPVRINATGFLVHDDGHLIELSSDVGYVDYDRECIIHMHDDGAYMYDLYDEHEDDLLGDDYDDDDFDGNFLDDNDIPALNAAAMHSEVDEMLRRAEADAAFYGVRG